MEEFVSLGEWWLPSNPEVVVAGKLSFSPSSGAKLQLIGSFYNLPFQETGKVEDLPAEDTKLLSDNPKITEETITFNYINREDDREETIILGCLENNEEITLYKCSGSTSSVRLGEIDKPNFLFEATYIFRKIHFNTEQEIRFNSISVRYPNLEKWVGKSGIERLWSPAENKVWISYQPPSSIPLVEFKELDISITFSPIYINPLDIHFGGTYYKGNVEQKTFLTLHNLQNKSINDCIKIIIHFRDFLTFAISRPSSILSVTGNINVTYNDKSILNDDGSFSFEKATREDQINILFGFEKSEKSFESTILLHEMLFIYSDIEGNLGEVFKQWVDKKEVYESVFELFMITMYTPNLYINYSFFNMIQALETYHNTKYENEGKYQEEVKYKNGIYNSLLEAINKFPSQSNSNPDGISDEFRKVLKNRLDFINEYSLQTKLKEILKNIADLLPDDFIGTASDRDSFISRASNTRHGLTHHKKQQKKNAAKGKELVQIFHTLKIILQCCLLQELGFTHESIKKLIERNRNYSKEWHPQKITIQLSDNLSIDGYMINSKFRPITTETSVLLGYKENWLNKLLNSKSSQNLKDLQSKGFTGDIQHPAIGKDGEIRENLQIKTISLRDFLKLIFFEKGDGNKEALTIVSILTKVEQQTLEEKRKIFGLTYDEFIGALAENQTELGELRLSGNDLYDTEEVDKDEEAKEDLNP